MIVMVFGKWARYCHLHWMFRFCWLTKFRCSKMEVSKFNDIKIYNLSAGKNLPDWITERKRRALVRNDPQLQQRIQLLQDFEMPTASTKLRISPDGQYILSAGKRLATQYLSRKFLLNLACLFTLTKLFIHSYLVLIFLEISLCEFLGMLVEQSQGYLVPDDISALNFWAWK